MSTSFRGRITQAATRFASITEDQAASSPRPGDWTRKQYLGHLIDSVIHNHVRIVRAATVGHAEDTGYLQKELVELHGYNELPWTALVAEWQSRNEFLARVVERLTSEQLQASCKIDGD